MKLPFWLEDVGSTVDCINVRIRWWARPFVWLYFVLMGGSFSGEVGCDAVLICDECGQEVNPKYADEHRKNHER